MAENRKLDMSLDDIIRLDGIKGPRRGGGRSGPPSGGRRDNFSRGSGGSNGRYQPKRLNTGGGFRANSYNGDRSYQQSRSGYSNGGGYRGRSSANGFEGGRGLGGGGGGRRQCTLHVSNLASTVNAEDVEELFSTFGDLVRSTVHYDQHGSSLGTADVVFEQRENATEARHKLNNVPLD
ncbi:PREDICTED: THO complex subunit 4-like, partial [Rhagoletis zephyria]|uniref:THO complex subunit 4-like n=1 Tax=Rhagoletis zephyria TaxID=28612 RepID=UPI000811A06B